MWDPDSRAQRGDHRRDPRIGSLPSAVDPFALSLNENPFPPLPAVVSALTGAIDAANRYPEFLPERLRRLIANHIGVPEGQVIVGAGATGVTLQILHAVADPGDRVVMPDPTFEGHAIVSRMTRLTPVKVPLDEFGKHDLRSMVDASSDARVVVICRPHNPTGTIESALEIEEFLARVPSDTIVLLDEAYVEFVAREHWIDSSSLVERYPNLIVIRTFSKAYGLAGLRIGYAFGSRELADKLWAMQLPFGMGITSFVAVAASYDAESQLRQRIRRIRSERRSLCVRLRATGVYTTDAHANFVYLPPADTPWTDVFDKAGVRVKHYANGGVRITIGSRSSTSAVLRAVQSVR
ncbi:aminotransferase class I/II-fold pyridoxal phosphate-dependent enzyme [Mycolicibacterium moriokaense]|nr:aminotransferase class I/II-fold pyridoxal phosphate-dependent enzyme [Mycolicibacterium moriokaense]